MKGNQIFALGGFVSLFFALLAFNIYQDYKKDTPTKIIEAELEPLPPGKRRHIPIKDLTAKPIKADKANGNGVPECRSLFSSLAEMTIQELYDAAENNPGLILDNRCFRALSSAKQYPYWDNIHNVCLRNGGNFNSPDCKKSLINYRIMAVGILFDNNNNLNELDDATIVAKLLWNYMKGTTPTQVDLDYSLYCAEELSRRLPDLYAAHKAQLVTLVLKEIIYKESDLDQKIEEVISELNKFHVDEDLKSFMLTRKILKAKESGQAEDMKSIVNEYIQENPDDYVGYYYAASVYWKQKDRVNAQSYISKAIEIAPLNRLVKDTAAKLPKADFAEKIFSISFNLNFSEI